ncbi:M15 family metallopeptidase [Thalassotalea marina]|uniref:Peptidase M15 n=1 Tax=Thalassotalea marina TaxID=1673741 RepID=A0A919BIM1_9GAMM|nr:M15 family metallopeptidase [Thalassotalea marina]GHF93557.1 peptidase M15 [Thalassotalea marina]
MKITNSILTGSCDQHIYYITKNLGLHKDVLNAWQQLHTAAKDAGFDLAIASGFRGFDRQLSIWNRKFTGELPVKTIDNLQIDIIGLEERQQVAAVMLFSALPATSRHHWGTDLDFYSPSALTDQQKLQLEPWEYQGNGPFGQLTQWLAQNAHDFGFYFPYDQFRGGVAAEPWHLSYFPLASEMQQRLTSGVVFDQLKQCDIAAKSYILENITELMTQYVYNVGKAPHG